MKLALFIITLFLVSSCNDVAGTRSSKCIGADNRYVSCSSSGDTLSEESYRKKYIAEVTTQITVGQSQIVLKDYAHDSDFDQELTCELEISKNKQFTYSFEDNKLVLKDGLSTLILTRQNGLTTDNLEGSWTMQEVLGKVQTITEVIFSNLEEVKIRKTCNLK